MRRSADFVFGINQFVNSTCQFAARDGSQTPENVNGLFARRESCFTPEEFLKVSISRDIFGKMVMVSP
jgi:hypothetical protein